MIICSTRSWAFNQFQFLMGRTHAQNDVWLILFVWSLRDFHCAHLLDLFFACCLCLFLCWLYNLLRCNKSAFTEILWDCWSAFSPNFVHGGSLILSEGLNSFLLALTRAKTCGLTLLLFLLALCFLWFCMLSLEVNPYVVQVKVLTQQLNSLQCSLRVNWCDTLIEPTFEVNRSLWALFGCLFFALFIWLLTTVWLKLKSVINATVVDVNAKLKLLQNLDQVFIEFSPLFLRFCLCFLLHRVFSIKQDLSEQRVNFELVAYHRVLLYSIHDNQFIKHRPKLTFELCQKLLFRLTVCLTWIQLLENEWDYKWPLLGEEGIDVAKNLHGLVDTHPILPLRCLSTLWLIYLLNTLW